MIVATSLWNIRFLPNITGTEAGENPPSELNVPADDALTAIELLRQEVAKTGKGPLQVLTVNPYAVRVHLIHADAPQPLLPETPSWGGEEIDKHLVPITAEHIAAARNNFGTDLVSPDS